MVSVACLGVRVSVLFFTLCLFIILLVRFWMLSGHLLGNSCQLGWQYVLIVCCLFVIFIFRFGFKSGIWLLIAPVPFHCSFITCIYSFKATFKEKCCGFSLDRKQLPRLG